jgi:hypothetical protein
MIIVMKMTTTQVHYNYMTILNNSHNMYESWNHIFV